jgi:hypothetical protein
MKGSALNVMTWQSAVMARNAASEVARSPTWAFRPSTTPHSQKARTPAVLTSWASFSALSTASSPVAPLRASSAALMSAAPFTPPSDMVADIKSTLSKELVFGSALRHS